MKSSFLNLIFTFFTLVVFSQTQVNQLNNGAFPFDKLPDEKLYLHINTANLFAGEHFYYKVYNIDTETKKLSNYSKIAYISLVGQNNRIVFTQKVRLKNGQGYADYLIPTDIPSGNYKLVAYTKMALNYTQNNAFITGISIINPYTPLDPDLVNITEGNDSSFQSNTKEELKSNIQITLPKQNFGNRERVTIQLTGDEKTIQGNYSVSVNKIDEITGYKRPNIINYPDYQMTLNIPNGKNFLPELRGELLTGKITATESNVSIMNQPIALSIPEENFVLKVGATNNEGRFYINIDERYVSNTALLQVLNNDNEKYEFSIDANPSIDYSSITFEKLNLSEDLKELIVNRSIKNQIENSYFSVKQNTLAPIDKQLFFGKNAATYILDDFTRFTTLNETLTEIVNNAWFDRINRGGYELKVRAIEFELRSPFPALVMIDGILIQDHSQIYSFNTFNVKQIQVLRDKYFYGGMIFQGIVSIETFEKNYHTTAQLPYLNEVELFRPELLKDYFSQDYSQTDSKNEKIPDFRLQLLWNPILTIDATSKTLDFYTSDETGSFEIVIEGINNEGKLIKANKQFTVN